MKTKKVLVVDDSKLLHRMFEMMLRGFPLVHAFDGREALDRLAEHKDVELILLDINMPRMNGLEFLTAVKAHPEFARIDRKSTCLNSSHLVISYAVFCLKKKKTPTRFVPLNMRRYARYVFPPVSSSYNANLAPTDRP